MQLTFFIKLGSNGRTWRIMCYVGEILMSGYDFVESQNVWVYFVVKLKAIKYKEDSFCYLSS